MGIIGSRRVGIRFIPFIPIPPEVGLELQFTERWEDVCPSMDLVHSERWES